MGKGGKGVGEMHPPLRGSKTSPLPCDRKMGTHYKKSMVFSTLYPHFLAFFIVSSSNQTE